MRNEEIYDRYAKSIERFFMNKVAARADVDDLMHETFMRFFVRREVEAIADPGGYLFGIARLVSLEYWRRRQKALDRHEDIRESSIASLGAGMTTIVTREENQRIVLDALRQLRHDYQVAIELYYWEKRSYKQIAVDMDEKAATIGVWLRRAKQQLRQIIERELAAKGARARPSRDTEDTDDDRDIQRWMEGSLDEDPAGDERPTGPGDGDRAADRSDDRAVAVRESTELALDPASEDAESSGREAS